MLIKESLLTLLLLATKALPHATEESLLILCFGVNVTSSCNLLGGLFVRRTVIKTGGRKEAIIMTTAVASELKLRDFLSLLL